MSTASAEKSFIVYSWYCRSSKLQVIACTLLTFRIAMSTISHRFYKKSIITNFHICINRRLLHTLLIPSNSYEISCNKADAPWFKVTLSFLNKGCQFTLICQIFSISCSQFFFVNLRISQSAHCKIDHPKMHRFSKRENLLKNVEAIAKSNVVNAYINFVWFGHCIHAEC